MPFGISAEEISAYESRIICADCSSAIGSAGGLDWFVTVLTMVNSKLQRLSLSNRLTFYEVKMTTSQYCKPCSQSHGIAVSIINSWTLHLSTCPDLQVSRSKDRILLGEFGIFRFPRKFEFFFLFKKPELSELDAHTYENQKLFYCH